MTRTVRIVRGGGWVMIWAGLLILAFLAYQLWGTGLVTSAEQQAAAEEVDDYFDDVRGTLGDAVPEDDDAAIRWVMEKALRGAGMLAFDLVPGVRKAFARHTMGLAGRLPRLSRGVPLEEARALGDRLIVAVNDDASVTRLKGVGRPVNPLEQRLRVLAGLAAVDWVVGFSEDTPEALDGSLAPVPLPRDDRGEGGAEGPCGAHDIFVRNRSRRVLRHRFDGLGGGEPLRPGP